MAQRILGIDVGSHSVKAAELTRYLREFELIHFYEQTIVPNPRLSPEESTAASLKVLVEKHGLSADTVVVSLPSHHLSCRVIELPFASVKKIEQTLDYELEGYIPVPLDELLVDYHVLAVGEERSTVLAAYIPRSRFVKFLDLLQLAGVDPKYIGVDSIDLANIAQIAMVPQEAVYAIIDIGHQKTNLCVLEGQKLQYVRTVTLGGIHFTRAIQKAFRLNMDKAEALKIERGRVSTKEEELDQISRPCQRVVEELIVGIRQTYLGYRQIYPDREWSGVYLTGGTSRLPGLTDVLSAALKINVGTLDFLDLMDHRLDQADLYRDVMTLSVAQTLRVIFPNRAVKVNFRRGEFAFQRDFKTIGPEIRQLGLWFAAIFVLGFVYFVFSYYTLNKQIDRANRAVAQSVTKALPELKGQEAKGSKQLQTIVASKLAELQPQLEALKAGKEGIGALEVLLEISQKMPPKDQLTIDIDDFNYTGDHVRLDGRTVSFEAVDKVKSALSQSAYFKNVTTQNVVKGIRDEIKFSLSMDVVTAKGGES